MLEYKWVVLINTTIGIVMVSLDSSILTIALPDVIRSLRASVVDALWVVTGFQLITTALLLPFARLADMKGRVRPYNIGFAVFTLASVLCGCAQTGTQLVGFRLLQGIGAALLFANSNALITDVFPAWQRGVALGINMMAGTTGFVLGTVLGGVITEFVGWRYIFFINIPFGVFATVWAFLRLHDLVEPERTARFDPGGLVTFPLGIASILGGLTFVVLGRAGDPLTTVLLALGVLSLAVFVRIERRVRQPMLDFRLFRIRIFWAGSISLLLNALARGSTLFLLSWYFQTVLRNSPLLAGLKLLPMVATMIVFAPLAGRLSDRYGSRWLSTIGLVCAFVAQLWMASFPVTVSYVWVALALALTGTGNGLFNSPNTSALMGSVPINRRGIANGTRTLLNNTGQTLAIAAAMVILSTVMSYRLLAGLFTGTATGVQSINGQVFMRGFDKVFLCSAACSVVAIACSSLRGTEIKAIRPATVTAAQTDAESCPTDLAVQPTAPR